MKINKVNIKSTLNIHLLELVRLRIGYINECHYSIALHYNELKNFGETHVRLSLVSAWNHTHYFSEKERALFSLTDYIIDSNNNFTSEEVNTFLTPFFNKDEIARLIQAIKQIDVWTCSMRHFKSTICKKSATN